MINVNNHWLINLPIFFIDWCTKVMAVAFLKFLISRELESFIWHTKQSCDVTLVNKIHVADIFHLGSTFQVG